MRGVSRAESLASTHVARELHSWQPVQLLLSWESDVLFGMFADDISRCQKVLESVQSNNNKAPSLLFAGQIVHFGIIECRSS